ncbi:MAG: hypothetical protein ACTHXO_06365 [Actinomycetaceae bacterium]
MLVEGVPVTSARRTSIDVARFDGQRDALVVVDSALAAHALHGGRHGPEPARAAERARADLLSAVESLPIRSPGRRRALAVITWSSPWAESPWESHVRWIMLCWGRRDVIAQCRVDTESGTFFTDLAIPDGVRPDGTTRYVHIEFDGLIKYDVLDARERARVYAAERDRQRAIERLGDTVIRLDAKDAVHAHRVVARVERALVATRGWRLRPVAELGRL